MKKAVQAKHIPDVAVLIVVNLASRTELEGWSTSQRPVFLWEAQERLAVFPPKVVLAKLAALVRRKLLDGCPCGCRGDFVLTEAGAELLWRTP